MFSFSFSFPSVVSELSPQGGCSPLRMDETLPPCNLTVTRMKACLPCSRGFAKACHPFSRRERRLRPCDPSPLLGCQIRVPSLGDSPGFLSPQRSGPREKTFSLLRIHSLRLVFPLRASVYLSNYVPFFFRLGMAGGFRRWASRALRGPMSTRVSIFHWLVCNSRFLTFLVPPLHLACVLGSRERDSMGPSSALYAWVWRLCLPATCPRGTLGYLGRFSLGGRTGFSAVQHHAGFFFSKLFHPPPVGSHRGLNAGLWFFFFPAVSPSLLSGLRSVFFFLLLAKPLPPPS